MFTGRFLYGAKCLRHGHAKQTCAAVNGVAAHDGIGVYQGNEIGHLFCQTHL